MPYPLPHTKGLLVQVREHLVAGSGGMGSIIYQVFRMPFGVRPPVNTYA